MIKRQNWRTNDQIRAPKVRLIDEKGKLIGILDLAEALKKKKEGLDLVEIAPMAKPPVVKLIDFGKFIYEEEKKLKEQKKKTKAPDIKEVRFSPFIAENDHQVRMGKIREFLEARNKIKVVVKFKGRQMGSKKYGYGLLDKLVKELGDQINVDMEPKFLGRHLIMVISPKAKKK